MHILIPSSIRNFCPGIISKRGPSTPDYHWMTVVTVSLSIYDDKCSMESIARFFFINWYEHMFILKVDKYLILPQNNSDGAKLYYYFLINSSWKSYRKHINIIILRYNVRQHKKIQAFLQLYFKLCVTRASMIGWIWSDIELHTHN